MVGRERESAVNNKKTVETGFFSLIKPFYFQASRTFSINYETNSFEMNGKKFQYVSGSFHYFRAVPDAWEDRLRTMRTAGLNVLDTYVEWSLHNPQENVYDFDGIADVERFLTLAEKQGFYVILRPGPYICAERDNVSLIGDSIALIIFFINYLYNSV